ATPRPRYRYPAYRGSVTLKDRDLDDAGLPRKGDTGYGENQSLAPSSVSLADSAGMTDTNDFSIVDPVKATVIRSGTGRADDVLSHGPGSQTRDLRNPAESKFIKN